MQPRRLLVWDLPVRMAHWLLVLGVCGSWITHYAGPAWFGWHRRCGYAVLVLVAFRITWGFVGSRHARFAAFLRGPGAIAAWLRAGAPPLPGHNPLGALSVVAMLLLLLVQAVTGLFANDEISSVGPFYGWVTHEFSKRVSRLHRANESWLLVLIGLHLAAVAWYTFVRRRRLVRSMVTGYLDMVGNPGEPLADGRSPWWALLVVLALVAMLAALLSIAPDGALVLAWFDSH